LTQRGKPFTRASRKSRLPAVTYRIQPPICFPVAH